MQRLQRAGLGLAYDDTAQPDRPPMLLLHGWCSRRADLAALGDAFRGSHRVAADLPGHGDSDVPADEERLGVTSFADDTAALCGVLGLRGTVVAHSGGAAVAVELTVRRPDLVAAVVALDGTLGFPAEVLEQTAPLLGALRSPAWREVIAGFRGRRVPARRRPGPAPPDRRGRPAHAPARGRRRRRADRRLGRRGAALAAFGATGPPLCYIQSGSDLDLADLDRLAKLVPNLTMGRVVGLGHDQLLATPAQPVAMIERFLAVTPAPA